MNYCRVCQTAKSKSRLEDLPNELLADIFKNLNARQLFQAFYNLNYRLNQLLQSFQYLQLYFHINPSHNLKSTNEHFSQYVHTLVVEPWTNLNLRHFSNVHRLKLNIPLPNLSEQLKPDVMPYLEDLSISFMYDMYELELLRERIFSNSFIHLKSCELLEEKKLIRIPKWTQSPSIKIFKTGFIDSDTYKIILSAFPNLYFLKFSMFSLNGIPKDVHIHRNLKRMVIHYGLSTSFNYDDNILSAYLSWVPNLEILEIHRRTYRKNLQEHFQTYDWLASIIHYRLSILKKFKFYFSLSNHEETIETIDEKLFVQIQSDFKNVHNHFYKAQLKIIGE